jgi:Phosphate uptake regulator
MVTDLERMGDYCVNIAREVILIGKEPLMKELKDIPKMRDIILNMIDATKISFKELDADLAIEVSRDDEMIDEIYKDIYNEVLLKIHENRENISQGTKLLFIGRYLERIADHLTNVCEKNSIYY